MIFMVFSFLIHPVQFIQDWKDWNEAKVLRCSECGHPATHEHILPEGTRLPKCDRHAAGCCTPIVNGGEK